jgi:hypothetical protein
MGQKGISSILTSGLEQLGWNNHTSAEPETLELSMNLQSDSKLIYRQHMEVYGQVQVESRVNCRRKLVMNGSIR